MHPKGFADFSLHAGYLTLYPAPASKIIGETKIAVKDYTNSAYATEKGRSALPPSSATVQEAGGLKNKKSHAPQEHDSFIRHQTKRELKILSNISL